MSGIYGNSAEDRAKEVELNRLLDGIHAEEANQDKAEQAVLEWVCENKRDLLQEAIGEMEKTEIARFAFALSLNDSAAAGEIIAGVIRGYACRCYPERLEAELDSQMRLSA